MNASRTDLATRLLYVLFFAVAASLLWWIVGMTAITQIVLRVFSAPATPILDRFSMGLARYAAQVIAYVCFQSDLAPFPFSDWPDPAGGPRS